MSRIFVVVVCFLAACGQEPGVPSQSLSLKAAGLWLTSNPLDAPEGALSEAKNTVIRRPGVAEKRRGNAPDATFGGDVLSVTEYAGFKLVHTDADTLERRDSASTSTPYTGTFEPPTGAPVRFASAGGSLYFTSAAGVYRLESPTGTPILAGEPPGLEGSAALTGSSGWLSGGTLASGTVTLGGGAGDVTVVINGTSVGPVPFNATDAQTALDTITAINANVTLQPLVTASSGGSGIILITADTAGPEFNYTLTASRTAGTATASGPTLTGGVAGSTVGYRVLWGRKLEDGTLIVGAPSGRFLVTNSTGATRDVLLTTPIPGGITVNVDFLQVYRTVVTASAANDPGEDMAQVAEVFPTATQISAGSMTATDIASFSNGETAYFSPSLGPGLADTRERPPRLTDLVPFKGYMVGVVDAYAKTLTLSLISTGGTLGLQSLDGITLVDFASNTQTLLTANNAVAEGASLGTDEWAFKWFTGGSVGQDIEDTARSLVRVINLRSSAFTATYASASDELPGKIIIRKKVSDNSSPTIFARNNGKCWTPALSMFASGTATRAANVVTMNVAGPHPALTFAVDDQIVVFGSTDPDFPDGVKTITSVGGANFTYAEVGPNVGVGVPLQFHTNVPDFEFITEKVPGSWAHSALQEYDGWPPRFRFQVEGINPILYRITPQGDALLFWTSEGLFRLSGEDENSFTLRPLDTTYILAAQNTPVTVGGKAYAVTTRGVVSVQDETVTLISGPVDELLNDYYNATDALLSLTESAAFGVGNESEQEYMLFLPSLTGAPGDPATRAYVYNAKTGTWVGPWEWEWAAINPGTKFVRTGMVGSEGRLWLASADRLTQERKARTLADYQDTTGAGIAQEVDWQVQTANNPGLMKQWVELTALLESPQPATVGVFLTTELDSADEGGPLNSQGNLAVRTGIPRNKSRSARLGVSLRNSTVAENMSLLGLSVIYNGTSPKVGR